MPAPTRTAKSGYTPVREASDDCERGDEESALPREIGRCSVPVGAPQQPAPMVTAAPTNAELAEPYPRQIFALRLLVPQSLFALFRALNCSPPHSMLC